MANATLSNRVHPTPPVSDTVSDPILYPTKTARKFSGPASESKKTFGILTALRRPSFLSASSPPGPRSDTRPADPSMAVPASMMGISISLFSVFTALLIGAGCFALGFLLAQRETKGRFPFWYIWTKDLTNRNRVVDEDPNDPRNLNRVTEKKPTLEIENLAEIIEDFKMVLVVRNDLKMGKGKIAAQCSHATLGLYRKLLHRAPKALSRWENCGQVKVVLKIESEDDLLLLQGRAKSLKLPNHITIDAGRTQIAPNSRTVMAILGPSDLVDDVTGGLKLL